MTEGTDPGPDRTTADPGRPMARAQLVDDGIDELLRRADTLRDRPAAAVLAAGAIAVVVAFGWWLGRPTEPPPIDDAIPFATPLPTTTAPPGTDAVEPAEVVVHVAGAVERPGVVVLGRGSRIGDAVEAAGGPTAEADVHQLNLAAPLSDGLQIRVPTHGETVPATGTPAPVPAEVAGTDGSAEVINVNTAPEADLERLPGIGPALAAAIVEWRENNGPFTTVDDLLAVPGIGPAKLDGLIDQVAL